MASTVNITIQENLDAINLGVNDAESTVVITIVDGSNGYTPIKGVDYFDGINGRDGTDWSNVSVNNINQVAGNITLTVADIPNAENSTNKQNSLAVDGTNTKYPTVTAVNGGLAGKQNVMGADDNYVTDAQLVVISNTSGTNTGDETTTTIGVLINNSTDINTIEDADKIPMYDAGGIGTAFKHALWSLVKSTLKTYFDTLYKATFSENTAFNKNFGTTSGTVCEGNDSRLDKDKTIALTVTPASHTGNTTETVKYTVSIPANTFTTGDRIYQEILATAIGSAGVKTIRTYINDTADLVTPVLISTYFTNNLAYSLTSSFFVDSSSTMKSYKLGSTNAAVFTGSSNAAIGTYTIDWTVQQYLVLSVQLATGTDLIQLEALILKRDRA